jgi:hypothetical protein
MFLILPSVDVFDLSHIDHPGCTSPQVFQGEGDVKLAFAQSFCRR